MTDAWSNNRPTPVIGVPERPPGLPTPQQPWGYEQPVKERKALVVIGIICTLILTGICVVFALVLAALACFKGCGIDGAQIQRNFQWAGGAALIVGLTLSGISIARYRTLIRSNWAFAFLVPIIIVGLMVLPILISIAASL